MSGPVGMVFTRNADNPEAFLITIHDGSGARHAKPSGSAVFTSVVRGPDYREDKDKEARKSARRDSRSRRPSAMPMRSRSPSASDRERVRAPSSPELRATSAAAAAAAEDAGGPEDAESAEPVRIFLQRETIYNGANRTLTVNDTYLNPDGSSECVTKVSRNHNGNIASQESDGSGLRGPKKIVNRMRF